MKLNEYAMIAGIFAIGMLVIGFAAFGLFNQVSVLETENTDLNIFASVSENSLLTANATIIQLQTTATQNRISFDNIVAQNGTLVRDNNIFQFNYNVAQQELIDQRVLMEQTMIDNNNLIDNLETIEIFFKDEFNIDVNIHDDNFMDQIDANYVSQNEFDDFSDLFIELRNDFGYCYWEHHCLNDANGCQEAYGTAIDANILATLFAASCETISDNDYNAYADFE